MRSSRRHAANARSATLDYELTLANGNVAAGQQLDIIAINRGADESVRLDGRAELDGNLPILSGAFDDQLFGGAKADMLSAGSVPT